MMLWDWLADNSCTHFAMEATGGHWSPVWHILAGGDFELILANAAHVKNVPGRKTDVSDAELEKSCGSTGLLKLLVDRLESRQDLGEQLDNAPWFAGHW